MENAVLSESCPSVEALTGSENRSEEAADEEAIGVDSTYEDYRPAILDLGAKHPDAVVESYRELPQGEEER